MGQPDDTSSFLEQAFKRWQADENADVPQLADVPVQPEPAETMVETDEPAFVGAAPARELTASERALIDEAMKKSSLVWVQTTASPAGRAVWHAWVEDTMYVVTGVDEQPDPGVEAGSELSIVVRSKETTSRLLSLGVTASTLTPDAEDWAAATTELAKTRLNLTDSEGAAARWGSDPAYRLYRLTPNGQVGERPGDYSDESHRAAPVPTAATTAGPKPKILHRRHGSGRALS